MVLSLAIRTATENFAVQRWTRGPGGSVGFLHLGELRDRGGPPRGHPICADPSDFWKTTYPLSAAGALRGDYLWQVDHVSVSSVLLYASSPPSKPLALSASPPPEPVDIGRLCGPMPCLLRRSPWFWVSSPIPVGWEIWVSLTNRSSHLLCDRAVAADCGGGRVSLRRSALLVRSLAGDA